MTRLLAWLVVIFGALAAIGYYAYADVWTVPADDPRLLVSIEPTLRGGDIVLVARHGPPAVGNLVRCTDPDEPRRWVVARVIATGGQEIHVINQTFNTFGTHETSDTACEPIRLTNPASGDDIELQCRNAEFAGVSYRTLHKSEGTAASEHLTDLKVPPGKAYLLSDDRYLHLDSRDYGTLDDTSCRRVFFRFWGAAGFSDGSRRFNIVW
jgi:signal peptidase I